MTTVHINIGSNLGDSLALIGQAVAEIRLLQGVAAVSVSAPYASEPWGFESSNRFTNVGVRLATDLSPFALLDALEEVERAVAPGSRHRNSDGTYRDRPLDIDIIAYGSLRLATTRLTLPHPRATLRDFVMLPLLQLEL